MTLPSPAAGAAAIRPEIDRVFALISTAGAHLEEGRMIDLTALEHRVEMLCSTLLATPREITHDYVAALKDIVVALDGLNAEINQRVRTLATGAMAPDAATAAGAYGKVDF